MPSGQPTLKPAERYPGDQSEAQKDDQPRVHSSVLYAFSSISLIFPTRAHRGYTALMGKHRALVLGGGRIGRVIAEDLALEPEFEVRLADKRQVEPLRGIESTVVDLADPDKLRGLAADCDIVIGALPSHLGFRTLQVLIDAGCHVCDISFMAEDPRQLDAVARARGVTVVVDCGLAPGLTNMLVGYAAKQLDRVDRAEIYVGGLPCARHWPFEYRAGFSPRDVVEEYTRPVRLVDEGEVVVREALSDRQPFEVPGLGTLEAFNTDGLRTLIETIEARFLVEKTLRYPGHAELMRIFRHTGFFGQEAVAVGERGDKVRPIELTEALLFPHWRFAAGEADLTVLDVEVCGTRGDEPYRFRWRMLDRYDAERQRTSMARTTAFPCAIVARLVAGADYRRPGVSPPEFLGRDPILFGRICEQLEQRSVSLQRCGSV